MAENSTAQQRAAAFYENALHPAGSCCGGGSNAFMRAAGYGSAELKDLPEDAVGNSFGCGNPLAFAGVRPGETVLDLGCGAGIDLLIAAKQAGPKGKVIGVDLSEVMLERARANAAQAGATNIDLRQGTIEALPVEPGTVDWVISNCVINLSPDKSQVFEEIRRVLKPGGHMLMSDMVAERLPDWIVHNAGLQGACMAGTLSEHEYLAAVRDAKLTNIAVVDRLVYDDSQLRALLGELLPSALDGFVGSPEATTKAEILAVVVAAISGSVQSLKISAARPI